MVLRRWFLPVTALRRKPCHKARRPVVHVGTGLWPALAVAACIFCSNVGQVEGQVDDEVIYVVQVPRGTSARLHCSRSSRLGHVLTSGQWSARWQRAFRPHADADMSSTAAPAIILPAPSGQDSTDTRQPSLMMNSTLRMQSLQHDQQDLYTCTMLDGGGKMISKCTFVLLLETDEASGNAGVAERIAGLTQHQQKHGVHVTSTRADKSAVLSCWYATAANSTESDPRPHEWRSGGESLNTGVNKGLSYQTQVHSFALHASRTPTNLRLHQSVLIVFARGPVQNFTCSPTPAEGEPVEPATVTSHMVVVGEAPLMAAGSRVSKPRVRLAIGSSGDVINATCFAAAARTAAHNSRTNTPTPVWVINNSSSSSLEQLPSWVVASRCAVTGQWVSVDVQRALLASDTALSCLMERHTEAAGQPHCNAIVSLQPDNVGDGVLLEAAPTGPADRNKTGGVHVESLQSDGIIAVVILGVALLVSVTTVIAVYKRREHNIIVRRIRQRHRYTPKSMSEANISTV